MYEHVRYLQDGHKYVCLNTDDPDILLNIVTCVNKGFKEPPFTTEDQHIIKQKRELAIIDNGSDKFLYVVKPDEKWVDVTNMSNKERQKILSAIRARTVAEKI